MGSKKLKDVLDEELNNISLNFSEIGGIIKIASDFVSRLKKVDKNIKVEIGGSLAKGTLIKKRKQDVDIFVVFKEEKDTIKLEGILRKAKVGELNVVHGSRDYFKVLDKEKGLEFEIIPVVENKNPSDANNVTDVSLKHVKYVKSKLKGEKGRKLANDIKLAKAFCFGCGVYGAESYIKGFSGYALECLIIYFGGFEKFLKNIGKKKFIDLEKHFKNEKEALREINKSKLQSPFVLVDPTYKYRNVVAGLSRETFEKFMKCSNEFLKNPSLEAFEKEDLQKYVDNMKKLAKSKKTKFIEFEFSTDRQEGDIAGTKMKKFFEFIVSSLERKGQEVVRRMFFYSGEGQKAKGYLVLRENKEMDVRGPANYLRDAIDKFKKYNKNSKIYEKKGFFWKKEKVDLGEIFNHLKVFEKEMGVIFKIVN